MLALLEEWEFIEREKEDFVSADRVNDDERIDATLMVIVSILTKRPDSPWDWARLRFREHRGPFPCVCRLGIARKRVAPRTL